MQTKPNVIGNMSSLLKDQELKENNHSRYGIKEGLHKDAKVGCLDLHQK